MIPEGDSEGFRRVIPKESGRAFRFIPEGRSDSKRRMIPTDSGGESERSDASKEVIIKAPNSSQCCPVKISRIALNSLLSYAILVLMKRNDLKSYSGESGCSLATGSRCKRQLTQSLIVSGLATIVERGSTLLVDY